MTVDEILHGLLNNVAMEIYCPKEDIESSVEEAKAELRKVIEKEIDKEKTPTTNITEVIRHRIESLFK